MYTKAINSDQLLAEISLLGLNPIRICTRSLDIYISFQEALTENQKNTLDAAVSSHTVDLLSSHYTNTVE